MHISDRNPYLPDSSSENTADSRQLHLHNEVHNIVWKYASHNKIHSCKVICVFLKFLCIILYSVAITHMLGNSLTNIYKQ